MDLIGSLFLFVALIVLSYTLTKKQKDNMQQLAVSSQSEQYIAEEMGRRRKIIEKVEGFLKTATFIEPIAIWKKENIYRYVHNGVYIYEFDEIMVENNQRIGIDEDYLCFKQLCYKRISTPVELIKLNLPDLITKLA